MANYQEWIDKNIEEAYGTCKESCLRMLEDFPELRMVRGHYYCFSWGEREHWWLKDLENKIVDPTKDQFPSKGTGHYEEWIEGTPEPTGKCPNCGDYCYDGNYCCSENCHISYVAYCNNP